MAASMAAAQDATDDLDVLACGFETFLDAMLESELRAATEAGALRVDDPETVTRLLFGALNRAAMLIANSEGPVATRQAVGRSMRALMAGFVTSA
jgi:threonine synthase